MIKQKEYFRPYRRLITVNTVDGFQGQERDIILISLVRSNDGGDIGFLRDLRRMNVAITRARMKLIILGSAQTMTSHPFYKRLYEFVEGVSKRSKRKFGLRPKLTEVSGRMYDLLKTKHLSVNFHPS